MQDLLSGGGEGIWKCIVHIPLKTAFALGRVRVPNA